MNVDVFPCRQGILYYVIILYKYLILYIYKRQDTKSLKHFETLSKMSVFCVVTVITSTKNLRVCFLLSLTLRWRLIKQSPNIYWPFKGSSLWPRLHLEPPHVKTTARKNSRPQSLRAFWAWAVSAHAANTNSTASSTTFMSSAELMKLFLTSDRLHLYTTQRVIMCYWRTSFPWPFKWGKITHKEETSICQNRFVGFK